MRRLCFVMVASAIAGVGGAFLAGRGEPADVPIYHSPLALALSPDGATLYISDYTAGSVAALDVASGKVSASAQVRTPYGLAVSPDGGTLYVASADNDAVVALALPALQVRAAAGVGRRPVGLALSPDGATLYCCNQLTDDVSVIDTEQMQERSRLKALREPRFCAVAQGGSTLVVSNQLPEGSNLDDDLGAEVSLINLADGSSARVKLARGATDVGQVCCSPDGRFAYVVHVLARWLVPPTQLERGWVSTNALTVIDVENRRRLGTVLIDDLDRGAANGYGVALSEQGDTLFTTHYGTNELQIVDTAKLHKLITEWPADSPVALEDDLTAVYRAGVRKRVKLAGVGARPVVCRGPDVFVGCYFSGEILKLRASDGKLQQTLTLGEQPEMDLVRRGEILFNDAQICFQGWQSCTTCHPDGRTDGLAWDLLNDGIGNPKNAKSLLWAHKTPPSMAHGVRQSMEVAVASGLKYILFHMPTEEEIAAVSAYIGSMQPDRSPYRNPDGALSAAAERGKAIFESPEADCARCHPAPLFTDLQMYDVGTKGPMDREEDDSKFDTPTLVELFRTGPYLHDGSAVTLREVLKDRNAGDVHGKTSHLSDEQLADLIEYLLSL